VFFVVNKTRQKSDSLEPMIDFLALEVRKLWLKNHKLIS